MILITMFITKLWICSLWNREKTSILGSHTTFPHSHIRPAFNPVVRVCLGKIGFESLQAVAGTGNFKWRAE